MENLIKALQIFMKYQNLKYPTNTSHDTLHIMGITKEEVSDEDKVRLDELGFIYGEEDGWHSFYFGSA